MTNKMILRLTSLRIFVFLWLLLIKDSVCHALNLQKYPTGITAIDAQAKCDSYGLVNDQLVLTKTTELYGLEFWIGQGIFTKLTPWIEIMGCFILNNPPTTVFTTTSPGSCEQECSTEYFGFNKERDTCSCFNSKDIQWTSSTNISSCKTLNVKTVLVYKIYNGTIKPHEEEHGLCSTLTCTHPNDDFIDEAPCKANSRIQGVCEDGIRSTTGKFWDLPQIETFKNCWNQDKLLLNSSACQYLEKHIKESAWTNVFREELEDERVLGYGKDIPKFCLSANISKSDNRNYLLNKHRQNCSSTLEWFVCKNGSIGVKENNEYVKTSSNQGALVGGSLGAVIVLLIVVSVVVCKIRRIGLFKSNNSTNTTTVTFTKSEYDDKTNLGIQTQQQFNQSYGLVNQFTEKNNKTHNSYSQVQKFKSTEDTYAESTNGEYDHLHNIDGRKPNAIENAYDSNAGVRNHIDPTYDTAKSSTRVDTDNTYDHSFTNMKTHAEYDVSDPSMLIDRTNNDIYDQTC